MIVYIMKSKSVRGNLELNLDYFFKLYSKDLCLR